MALLWGASSLLSRRKKMKNMGERSDVIEVPRTGERLVFLKRPRDTNGELLEIEFFVREFALAASRPHIHTNTEERVEVIAGTARMRRGREERSVGPGDTVVIPPGIVHYLRREGEESLHFRLQFRPPMKVETLFETLFGLHRNGKDFRHPLQTAVMAREHDTYLGGPPIWLQKPLIALLAAVGRLVGYQARYEEFSGPEEE
jgi:mannose-6-phosphate isomerase-like protein (cupin superfamily)